MKLNLFNQTNEDIKNYQKTLNKVFKKIKDKKNINIILVDDKQIKELNFNFRNINNETDVLSFVNEDDKKSNGDVFISLDAVKRQAEEYRHSIDREISFLAVHGYLHLKGYDHETKEEEKEMMALTELILSRSSLERI